MLNALFGFVFIILSGCASTSFEPRTEKYADVFADNSATDLHALSLSASEVDNISVLFDLPNGITESNGVFSVSNESDYEVLGTVKTQSNGVISDLEVPMYFYSFNEDEKWRKYLCWPQVPLTWLTLTAWTIVPLYYPCWTRDTNNVQDVNKRKKRIKIALQKGAKAMGADTIVLIERRNTLVVNVSESAKGPLAVTSAPLNEYEWTKGVALALRRKTKN